MQKKPGAALRHVIDERSLIRIYPEIFRELPCSIYLMGGDKSANIYIC